MLTSPSLAVSYYFLTLLKIYRVKNFFFSYLALFIQYDIESWQNVHCLLEAEYHFVVEVLLWLTLSVLDQQKYARSKSRESGIHYIIYLLHP